MNIDKTKIKDVFQVEDFLKDCCIIDERYLITVDQLYSVYSNWAEKEGQFLLTKNKFGRILYNDFNIYKDRNMKNRFWRGLSISK